MRRDSSAAVAVAFLAILAGGTLSTHAAGGAAQAESSAWKEVALELQGAALGLSPPLKAPFLVAPAGSSGSTAMGTFSAGLPGGDVNGDTLADVLLAAGVLYRDNFVNPTADRTLGVDGLVRNRLHFLTLESRRGYDGLLGWSRALDSEYDLKMFSAGDVNEDGFVDVLLYEFALRPAPPHPAVTAYLGLRYTISMVSGMDGATLWNRTVSGHILSPSVFGLALAPVYAGLGLALAPLPAGDLDNDGASDFVLNVIMQARTVLPTWFSTDAQLISGRTGATLLRREQLPGPILALLTPIPDAVGDIRPDLMWSRSSWASGLPQLLDIEVLDGNGYGTAWSKFVYDPSVLASAVAALRCDTSGDGKSDLLIGALTIQDLLGGSRATATIVDGASGTFRWRAEGDLILCLGGVDSTPGSEVALFNLSVTAERIDLSARRIDGDRGAQLFATTRQFVAPEGLQFNRVSLRDVADGDGDGVADWVLDGVAMSFDGQLSHSRSLVESGRTGAVLSDGVAAQDVMTVAAADLDGDFKTDLLQVRTKYAGQCKRDVEIAARAATATTDDWMRPFQSHPEDRLLVTPSPALTGAAGEDVVFTHQRAQAWSTRSVVYALDGDLGSELWRAGDPQAPPRC